MSHRLPWYAAMGLPLVVGMSLLLGCDSCPDLRYRAFEFEVSGDDPSHVMMTITDQATGEQPCQDIALAENCNASAGVYDMAFSATGGAIGELTGVCTLGELDGCAAEDAEQRGQWPLIRLERIQGVWETTLVREGACP